MRRLIDAAQTLELRALVRCFCELALRFSEATGLPLAAYDARQRTVRIRQQAAEQREPKPSRMVIKELFAPKLQRFLGHLSVTFTLARYGSHFSHGMLEPEEYLIDL